MSVTYNVPQACVIIMPSYICPAQEVDITTYSLVKVDFACQMIVLGFGEMK